VIYGRGVSDLAWFKPAALPETKQSSIRTLEALRRWRETGQFQLS